VINVRLSYLLFAIHVNSRPISKAKTWSNVPHQFYHTFANNKICTIAWVDYANGTTEQEALHLFLIIVPAAYLCML
jgi:hypothetical protein